MQQLINNHNDYMLEKDKAESLVIDGNIMKNLKIKKAIERANKTYYLDT